MLRSELLAGQPKIWTDERGLDWDVRYEREVILLGSMESVWVLIRDGHQPKSVRLYVKVPLGLEGCERTTLHDSIDDALRALRGELDSLFQDARTKVEEQAQAIDAMADVYRAYPDEDADR